MPRIVLLWLILTPIWIAFSFYASASKIAFLPPALVVVAAVLHWLHKHFVVAVAGEPEPRPRPVSADPWPSRSADIRLVARPSRNLFRPALIAVGVGACFGGAAMAFVHSHRPVADTAALATEPNAASSVQTEAVKAQPAAPEAKPLQAEAVNPRSAGAEAEIQDNAKPASSHDADAKRAAAQISDGQTSSSSPRCNVSLCETYYQSFRASDCTYQPYSGPRQYCAR